MSQNLNSYQQFIYNISSLSKFISCSELIVIPVGKSLCSIKGNIYFNESIRLEVREALDFSLDEFITGYSYAVFRDNEKLYWYDSQGHPNDPNLHSTHPHHKHVPPDIKHNRIPAPNLSFNESNLTFIIHEIEEQFFKL